MFNAIKNHIFTLHEKIELLILYGIIMFGLGIWLNHLFSTSPEELAEEIAGQIIEQQQEQVFLPLAEEPEVGIEEPEEKESYIATEMIVKRGDNFTNLLVKAGMDRRETFFAGKELSKVYNLRSLKSGQKIIIYFHENGEGTDGHGKALEFSYLEIEEPDRFVRLKKTGESQFETSTEEKPLNLSLTKASGAIETSLARLASGLGVPPNILNEVIRAYSYDVDFQRDIRKEQHFEVLYEGYFDEEGNKVRDGNVLYALLTIHGKDVKIYQFSPTGNENDWDYFTEEGRSLRRSLLKTPIDGAIVSSPFGPRVHPISGYTKIHRGVDFAAPSGTPFYAAGDGVIERIGRNGGYGNYVRIRHSAEYSTAYGHASRFAQGMRTGRKVKQGQIIAYVGTTGASTGPHLHFEILRNGKQINPARAKIPPGQKLTGKELDLFEKKKEEVEKLLKTMPVKSQVAADS